MDSTNAQLKEKYERMLDEINEFIENGITYENMTIDEFKKEVKLFWARSDIWQKALENNIYTKVKLDDGFNNIKRLLG